MKWLFILMAFGAGMVLPVQAGINSRLGGEMGGPVIAAFLSFGVGTLVLILWILALRIPMPLAAGVSQTQWWYWIGGALGAYFVAAVTMLAPHLGAAALVALILAGQMAASLLLDQFGLLGYPVIPFDFKRLAGAVLLVAGVLLIRK